MEKANDFTAAFQQQGPNPNVPDPNAPDPSKLELSALHRQESLAALEKYHRELSQRDALLNGVNAAAQCLLTHDNLADAIPEALRILSEKTQQDRIFILENVPVEETHSAPTEGSWYVPYEWNAPGQPDSSVLAGNIPIPMQAFPTAVVEQISLGKPIQLLTRNVTGIALEVNQARFAKSLVAVPIFVAGQWWGVMGFDDCTTERIWSEAEIAVLETAATCLGSAIEREKLRHAKRRTRQEKEATARVRAAELETYNQQLRARDGLLNCVNAAAQCLVATDDLSQALPAMLKILGEGTHQCRAYILNNTQDSETGGFIFNLMLEWDAEQIPSKMEAGAKFPVPVDSFPDHLTAPLKAGQAMQFFARELDNIGPEERAVGHARSLLSVPVLVSGQWWGLLGIDDCLEERVWSEAEIAVLETAATALGNAIERDLARKAREHAERAALLAQERATRAAELEAANAVLRTRDRWLETTATAASKLLSALPPAVSVKAALKTIGENLESDRIGIMQYLPEPDSLGRFHELYTWNSPSLERRMAEDDLTDLPASDFADWTAQLMAGESVGGPVAALSEPFRSKLQQFNTLYTYAVPIFIGIDGGAAFWGLMYMDYCQESRHLSPAELAVFNTAATCVGSAIYREHIQSERQQAERIALLEKAREQAAQARASQLQQSNEILSVRERWLDITAAAANRLLSADDLESAIAPTMEILGKGINADRVGIMKADVSDGNLLYSRYAEWASEEQLDQTQANKRPDFPAKVLGDRLNQRLGHGHWVGGDVEDTAIFPAALREDLKALGIQTSYSVPIFVSGEFWGVIGIDHCHTQTLLSETEIAVFQTIASCVGNAIQREQILQAREQAEKAILEEREQAARDRAAELAKINEAIGKTLTSLAASPELDQFLGNIIAAMAQQVAACKVHLFLYDESTRMLTQRVAVEDTQIYIGNAPSDPDFFRTPIPADKTPGWSPLIGHKRPLTYDEALPYGEQWCPETADWHKRQAHKAVTYIPMKAGAQPIGYVVFSFSHQTVLTDEQLEFMQALTNQAIVAIQLTRLAEQSQDAALAAALTDERNRLAREIHDTLAQSFTGISLQLEAVRSSLGKLTGGERSAVAGLDAAQSYVLRARDLARKGLSEARRSVRALRSAALETDALPEALRKALEQITQDTGLTTHLYLEGTPFLLPDDVQLNLLRISQEAITNALRHAAATQLDLTLSFSDTLAGDTLAGDTLTGANTEGHQVQILIVDNGIGFDTTHLIDNSGFGLIGIRERTARFHGTFELLSKPGIGTTLDIVIPIAETH